MNQWFKQPVESRLAANELISTFNDSGFKTLLAKSPEATYSVWVNGDGDKVKAIFEKFKQPSLPDDYEEDLTDDLNYLFIQIKDSSEQEKVPAFRAFFNEVKRLCERKRIIKVDTNTRPLYIRRVGRSFEDKLSFETCGDLKGMALWNTLSISDINRLTV